MKILDRKKIQIKLIAIALVLFLLLQEASYATPVGDFGPQTALPYSLSALSRQRQKALQGTFSRLEIPNGIGKIANVYAGSSKKIVFHIQDLHINEDVQRNIARIIDHISSRYGVRLIQIEGASGELAHGPLARYPNRKARYLAGRAFLKDGMITGPEYLAITKNPNLIIYGVEKKDLYEKNRAALLKAMELAKGLETEVNGLRKVLKSLAALLFTPAMRSWLENKESFENGKQSITGYVQLLKQLCTKEGMDCASPQIQRLLKLEVLENKIRRENHSKNEAALSRSIKNALAQEGYLDLRLFDEIRDIETKLETHGSSRAEVKKLFKLFQILEVYEKMFALSLTRENVEFLYQNRDEFAPRALRAAIGELVNRHRLETSVPPIPFQRLEEALRAYETFYELALSRDETLVTNAIDSMNRYGKSAAVLVTGGFHTPAIEEHLKKEGFSFCTIAPGLNGKIDFARDQQLYLKAMQLPKSPISQFARARDPTLQLQVPSHLPTRRELKVLGANLDLPRLVAANPRLDYLAAMMIELSTTGLRLNAKIVPPDLENAFNTLSRPEIELGKVIYGVIHHPETLRHSQGREKATAITPFSKSMGFALDIEWRRGPFAGKGSENKRQKSFSFVTPDGVSTKVRILNDPALSELALKGFQRARKNRKTVDLKARSESRAATSIKNSKPSPASTIAIQTSHPEEQSDEGSQSKILSATQTDGPAVKFSGRFAQDDTKGISEKEKNLARLKNLDFASLSLSAAMLLFIHVFFPLSFGTMFTSLVLYRLGLAFKKLMNEWGHVAVGSLKFPGVLTLRNLMGNRAPGDWLKETFLFQKMRSAPFVKIAQLEKPNSNTLKRWDSAVRYLGWVAGVGFAAGFTAGVFSLALFLNPVSGSSFILPFLLGVGTGLLIAFVSDFLSPVIPGIFNCGIFWITAKQLPEDGESLYPSRIESILNRLSFFKSLFGNHGVGAAVQFQREKTGERDYAHFKMPSGYNQNPLFYKRSGRTGLIKHFSQEFRETAEDAERQGARPGLNRNIAGHVRLKTSGGKLEVATTQPFYINPGYKIRRWLNENGKMVVRVQPNIAYSAANGDTQKARLPGQIGLPFSSSQWFSEEEWGRFFERAYNVTVGANDSEKAAYFIYFLRTEGSLADSLRLAYVSSFFKSLEDLLPSLNKLQDWEKKLEPLIQKYGAADWSKPDLMMQILNEAAALLPRNKVMSGISDKEYRKFLERTFTAFKQNDSYYAARIMMSMVNEFSTFGLFYETTLEPDKRVLISREAPVSMAENVTKGLQIGGSSLDFLKWTIRRDPLYKKGDQLRTLTLRMDKNHKERGGEIAEVNNQTGTVKIYSMNQERELSPKEVKSLWRDITNEPPEWVPPKLADYPMLNDLNVSLPISFELHKEWQTSTPEESTTLRSAEKFAERWIQKAYEYERINKTLQEKGIETPVKHGAPDLFIVVFREENIVVGEWFKELMKETFGFGAVANIELVNANDYIRSIESHPLYLNTDTVFLDLGYNFGPIRIGEEHARRVTHDIDVEEAGYEFLSDDPAETAATWKVMKLLQDRRPPHAFVLTPTEETNISRALDPSHRGLDASHVNVISTKYFPDVDGSVSVPWSQIVSLTELYLYLLKAMRREFPKGAPFGMIFTQRDIDSLEANFEQMIFGGLMDIIGLGFDRNGQIVSAETKAHQNLVKMADKLQPYFTEQARATAVSTVHLLIAVAFTGTVIQIVTGILLSGFGPLWGASSMILSFFSHLLDVPLFLFFKYLTIRFFRWREDREGLYRDQSPDVVLGDDMWGRLTRASWSKMFALAKGIISPKSLHNAKQLSELEGKHGHDARRGTMIILSGPPEMSWNDYVNAGHQGVALVKNQAESFASINAVAPMMVGIVDHPDVEKFKFVLAASIYSQEREKLRDKANFDNPDLAGRILEIAVNSPLRMMAHQVVGVELVRGMQDLKIGYPLDWDAQDNQNSIAATTQIIRPPSPAWVKGDEWVKTRQEALSRPAVEESRTSEEKKPEGSTNTNGAVSHPLNGEGKPTHKTPARSELRTGKEADKTIQDRKQEFDDLERQFEESDAIAELVIIRKHLELDLIKINKDLEQLISLKNSGNPSPQKLMNQIEVSEKDLFTALKKHEKRVLALEKAFEEKQYRKITAGDEPIAKKRQELKTFIEKKLTEIEEKFKQLSPRAAKVQNKLALNGKNGKTSKSVDAAKLRLSLKEQTQPPEEKADKTEQSHEPEKAAISGPVGLGARIIQFIQWLRKLFSVSTLSPGPKGIVGRLHVEKLEDRIAFSTTSVPEIPASLTLTQSATGQNAMTSAPLPSWFHETIAEDIATHLGKENPFADTAALDDFFSSYPGGALTAAPHKTSSDIPISVVGREVVSLDSGGNVSRIELTYSLDGVFFKFTLDNFRYDANGKPVAFSFTESRDGIVSRKLEGSFTEYDKNGRPVAGLVQDGKTDFKVIFKFEHPDDVSGTVRIITKAVVMNEGRTMVTVVIDKRNISFAKAESAGDEIFEPTLPIESQDTETIKKPLAAQQVATVLSNNVPVVSETPREIGLSGGGSGTEDEEENEGGISPRNALSLVPKTKEVVRQHNAPARVEAPLPKIPSLDKVEHPVKTPSDRETPAPPVQADVPANLLPEAKTWWNWMDIVAFISFLGAPLYKIALFLGDRMKKSPQQDQAALSVPDSPAGEPQVLQLLARFNVPITEKNSQTGREPSDQTHSLDDFFSSLLKWLGFGLLVGLTFFLVLRISYTLISIIYWGGLTGMSTGALYLFGKQRKKTAGLSWPQWIRRWSLRGILLATFLFAGKSALWFAPMPLLAAVLAVIYGATITGFLLPNIWRALQKKDVLAILFSASLIAAGYFGVRFFTLLRERPEARLAHVSISFSSDPWPAPAKRANPEEPAKQIEAGIRSPVLFKYQNLAPLLYDSDSAEVVVPLIAQKEGHVELDPRSGINDGDWQNPGKAFKIHGGQSLLRLKRPVTETRTSAAHKLVGYLSSIDQRYQHFGLYDKNLVSTKSRLFNKGAFLIREIENYNGKQEVEVFGEIRAPFKDGEEGWLLPGQRPLGTSISSTVLARAHSQNRLTLRVAVPISSWQHYDPVRMQVWVTLEGKEQAARLVRLSMEPRLDGKLILTLGLLSQEKIFDWDVQHNRPYPVHFRMEIPPREKLVSYSSQLPPGSLIRSYSEFSERVGLAVNATGAIGRTNFNSGEASWVTSNQSVAGVGAKDREQLRAIAARSDEFSQDVRQYLEGLQKLIDMKAAPVAPNEVTKFSEDFIHIRELLAKLEFMDYKAPQAGILTGTFNSESQAVQDRPLATVLTPQILTRQRIDKRFAIEIGEVVIIRRPATGEETLGIIRQVNRELANKGRGEDLSRFQEILIETNNTPRLWFADHEYGVEVVYAPASINHMAQVWLKAHYARHEKGISEIYNSTNIKSLPPLFPVRFVPPASEADQQLLIHLLEEPAPPQATDAAQPFHNLPPEVAREQKGDANAHVLPSDSPEIRRILQESNGGQRRQWMRLFLQNQNIPIHEIERIALNGPADVTQMSLDYLVQHRRIVDLVVVHRALYTKSPNLDMTKLARSQAIELIESDPDALKRLAQLEQSNPKRAVVQEFLILLLTTDNAAFDPDLSIAVRKILASNFWRIYAEKLALARSLEAAGHTPAAFLVRNEVFTHIAERTGWTLGEPQAHAKGVGPVERYDPAIWDRLHNMEKNEAQDHRWLRHSPWVLATIDPRENFKGRINDLLYEKSLKEYEALAAVAEKGASVGITVLPQASLKDGLLSDHVFNRLDILSRRNDYIQSLNLYALERFLTISERPQNQGYRERRGQIIDRLVNDNSPNSRLLLARVLVRTHDPDVVKQLFHRDVNKILIQETSRLKDASDTEPGTLMIYQQALAKLSGPKISPEGGSHLAVRALLDTLSDFELEQLAGGHHPVKKILEGAGVPERVIFSTANEQLNRRATLWAIEMAAEWSRLTLESQVHSPAESALNDLKEALGIENFSSARVETAWAAGLRDHPHIFNRLHDLFEFRRQEIMRGSDRDAVTHLETARLSVGIGLGMLGLLAGFLWRLTRPLSSKSSRSAKKGSGGLFSKFFSSVVIASATLLSSWSAGFASSPVGQERPDISKTADALPRAIDAKQRIMNEIRLAQEFDFAPYKNRAEELGLDFESALSGIHTVLTNAVLNETNTIHKGEIILNYRADFHTLNFAAQWAELMRTHPDITQLTILRASRTSMADWDKLKTALRANPDFSHLRIVFGKGAGMAALEALTRERLRTRKLSKESLIQVLEPSHIKDQDRPDFDKFLLGVAPLGEEAVIILGGKKPVSGVSHALSVSNVLETLFQAHKQISQSA